MDNLGLINFFLDISQIIIADVVLSGDNALVIGMAASQFDTKLRKKIVFYGLLIAAIFRILLAKSHGFFCIFVVDENLPNRNWKF